MENRRRISDRRASSDRHHGRRAADLPRAPAWEEQRSQHFTRYLFGALALVYFIYGEPSHLRDSLNLWIVGVGLVLYGVFISASLWHARRRLASPRRWRTAMWVDIVATSFAVFTDPMTLSPGYLAYLMIILGNGMRYGLRLFAEAVIGSFVCALLVLGYRLPHSAEGLSISSVFYILFFMIVIFYSYSLTARFERSKQRLEIERDRDDLTGLLNRRALFERTASLLHEDGRVRTRLVVLFADLDGFKAVNDNHGHHTGDRVLSEVGGLIGRLVRSDDVAARYGGDEFVLILPNADLESGRAVAQRLQDGVVQWARANDMDISVSIGIGHAPEHGEDLKDVMARVDQAMYQSKLAGRRGGIRVVGTPSP
jgi:diguanylate cyclase (GGDEF)-like protein